MGTNYYLRKNICPTCGRYDEQHIGKSSIGWTFSFHGSDSIRSYKDWLKILEKPYQLIFDEYGNSITLEDFKNLIESKKKANYNHAKKYPKDCWLDEEGNSFSGYEFS